MAVISSHQLEGVVGPIHYCVDDEGNPYLSIGDQVIPMDDALIYAAERGHLYTMKMYIQWKLDGW